MAQPDLFPVHVAVGSFIWTTAERNLRARHWVGRHFACLQWYRGIVVSQTHGLGSWLWLKRRSRVPDRVPPPPIPQSQISWSRCSTCNTMQSETADFASSAATWRTGRNIQVVFDYGPSLHYWKTWRHPQNSKYKRVPGNVFHCRQRRSEPRSRVTNTENLVKFGRVVFVRSARSDRQAYRQTCWSQYFAWGEAKTD